MQLFSARGVILLIIVLEEDEDKRTAQP